MKKNEITIALRTEWYKEKLKTLQWVYNIKSNTKLVEYLVDADLRRQGF